MSVLFNDARDTTHNTQLLHLTHCTIYHQKQNAYVIVLLSKRLTIDNFNVICMQ